MKFVLNLALSSTLAACSSSYGVTTADSNLRDLDEFVANLVGRTSKTGWYYGSAPCVAESIIELYYPDRTKLEDEYGGNALVVNAEKSPERLWEAYRGKTHRSEESPEMNPEGRRVDPQTARILLGLAMSLDKVSGKSYLMQALAIEDDPRIRGYLFLGLCWNLKGLGRPLRERFEHIPKAFDDLGRSFLGDAGATARATRYFREVLDAFGEYSDHEGVDRLAYHDLLAMLCLWSRIADSPCLDEIAESMGINHGSCSIVRHGPLFNDLPARYLLKRVLEDPNQVSRTEKWHFAYRNPGLRDAEKNLEKLISSYPIVERPGRLIRASDLSHGLQLFLFSPSVPEAAEKIPGYVIARASEIHLPSAERREYVMILGRIGGAAAAEALGKLSLDEDPTLAAEAVRSLAMRDLPLPREVDRSDRSSPLASAILFYEAKRGSALEISMYLEFVRQRLFSKGDRFERKRQLRRELASFIELEDMAGLRCLVEALDCPDRDVAWSAANLIGTVVILPDREKPGLVREWLDNPPLAYEPLRKTLEPTDLVATWDARRGYCVVSSRER